MVETRGTYTDGACVVDWWRVTDRAPNALFLRQVDVKGFFQLLTERLGRLP